MARIDNIRIDDDTYEVGKVATTSNLGVVQIGDGLSVTEEGVLSAAVPTWTYTTVDPGEGEALEANNFIGVYE